MKPNVSILIIIIIPCRNPQYYSFLALLRLDAQWGALLRQRDLSFSSRQLHAKTHWYLKHHSSMPPRSPPNAHVHLPMNVQMDSHPPPLPSLYIPGVQHEFSTSIVSYKTVGRLHAMVLVRKLSRGTLACRWGVDIASPPPPQAQHSGHLSPLPPRSTTFSMKGTMNQTRLPPLSFKLHEAVLQLDWPRLCGMNYFCSIVSMFMNIPWHLSCSRNNQWGFAGVNQFSIG